MTHEQSWDWSTDLKEIPIKEWNDRFNWVEDYCISPDGESIAAIVNIDEMLFSVCENWSWGYFFPGKVLYFLPYYLATSSVLNLNVSHVL